MTDQLSARERDGAGDDTAPVPSDDRTERDISSAGAPRSERDATPWRERRRQRVSRWDRPPEPHDWRFFVSLLGRILIATGLLMFGFVAYQLWGTGIETARAQQRLESEFEQLVAQATAADPAAPVELDTARPDPVADPPRDSAVDEASSDTAPSDLVVGEIISGDVETITPTDLSNVAVDQDIPPFERGDPLALLEIPAIGRSDIVVPGVALNDLKNGPGHYPDTPLPGQLGNTAIAGHRTTYGAPFFDVDQLERGDEIIVTMITGDRFVYEVTTLEIVSAADYWVVTTSDPNIAELTLTSCHPKYTARDRIVVHSLLNPAKSSNVGMPTFYDLDDRENDGGMAIPGDDPVLADPDPVPAGRPEATAADATGADTTEATPVVTDPIAGDAAEPEDAGTVAAIDDTPTRPADVGDAFGQGWFEDGAAWPQIALWAAALALISVTSYRISRRVRRYSVGIAVGVMPFVVALYFFYQNINRLLPPGI